MKYVSTFFALTLSTQAFAEIVVTKSIPLPHNYLDVLAVKLASAATRKEIQDAAVYYFEGAASELPVALACGPNTPNARGEGCNLTFFGKADPESFKISVLKSTHLAHVTAQSAKLTQLLKETNPDTAETHVNLMHPFSPENPAKPDGTHISCEPKQVIGGTGKIWLCTLELRDSTGK